MVSFLYMKLRRQPHLLELNAVIFLRRLSEKYKKALTLSTIPAEEWKTIASQGFDVVWLMGVWKRSTAARACALKDPGLRKAFDITLSGWQEKDVMGSPYAVLDYELDPILGPTDDLSKLKDILHQHGLKLFLDYVPNHFALDHAWTQSHPDYFVEGTEKDSKENPGSFFKTKGLRYLAHGRDPHFPAWSDSVQVNYFSPGFRQAAAETLLKIARVSDGVRCDMAMLGLNRVFENVWGRFLHQSKPRTEFWTDIISKVRRENPDFVFMGEVYWNLEWELQQLGFDFTYDKRLYDRLLDANVSEIRAHLNAELSYQEKSVRFLENHDESRVLSKFGREKSYAAAAVIATLPGMRFFYDGQSEGRRFHLPVQLGREPQELHDWEAEAFYKMLWSFANQRSLHDGQWLKHQTSHENLLCWSWQDPSEIRLIIINYSGVPVHGKINLPASLLKKDKTVFADRWSGKSYDYPSKEVAAAGLWVDLARWKGHLFEVQ